MLVFVVVLIVISYSCIHVAFGFLPISILFIALCPYFRSLKFSVFIFIRIRPLQPNESKMIGVQFYWPFSVDLRKYSLVIGFSSLLKVLLQHPYFLLVEENIFEKVFFTTLLYKKKYSPESFVVLVFIVLPVLLSCFKTYY